ncbi:hypothetical protein OEZ85_011814 [Tetradesmus obliquus]|uniref:HIT domain-containing protein n=1 Tax=Tetradesmus obliquus TaxID=3088 RepID=A0ABY8TS84_TETOB|nr:hypothetical protein OEZ85_011814 [Tetradesmus obliquus]
MPAQECSALWSKVLQVYDAAQASGAATKTDTQVTTCSDAGVTFVLRIAAALKAKPKGLSGSAAGPAAAPGSQPSSQQQQQQQQGPPPGFRNPFLPYEEALWVQHLSPSHTLLLNKFNVVPHHVLVVTRQFESQQDPLNAHDLAAAQQVLAAMPRGGVAFYNCGEHSGRSQPHKHLQIVPLPFDEEEQQQLGVAQPPVQQLINAAQAAAGAQPLQPFPVRQLPFRAYAVALDNSTTAEQLEAAASQLLSHCQAGLPAPVSYNVILTQELMLMLPRKQESCGRIAINSLGFAGTILLRSQEDLQFAQQQGPMSMLAEVGHPWSSEPAEAKM